MKKLLSLLLVLALVFALASCGGSSSRSRRSGRSRYNGREETSAPSFSSEGLGGEEFNEYFEKYLAAFSFFSPFWHSYTEETFTDNPDLNLYLLWISCAMLEGKQDEFTEEYGYENIPAAVIEDIIMRHFPITVGQMRALTDEGYPADYYADTNTYTFLVGYGGLDYIGHVVAAEQDGDILWLTCDWYNDYSGTLAYSHVVTIRLGSGEYDFFYVENAVSYNAAI